ncbi:hypothetical protein [Nannocystis pusilla]|uniref:hypothetical protein n=1 Tax=Nannocystis pusilla TaxID=889268 RepID=UPI003B8143BD
MGGARPGPALHRPRRAQRPPLSVRFTNTALADLAPWLDDGDPVALRLGDRRLPVPTRPPAA